MIFLKKSTFILLLYALCGFTQTELPSFFSDHMILQQNDSVKIWGKDIANKKIKIKTSWGEKETTMSNKKGHWMLKIKTPKASYKEYFLTVQGSSKVMIKNILIGEVWFASGQSNMEMPMKGKTNSPIKGANEFILHAKNNFIRLFKAKRSASFSPLEDVTGNWEVSSPESVKEFSALGYLFAKKLQKVLDIPVGIISASWGGTRIKAWTPAEALEKFDFITLASDTLTEINQKEKKKIPSTLFNGMIHPFLGYNIKGFLWYQGESDRFQPNRYKKIFPTMVASWRSLWDLPHKTSFYYVQIAPFEYSNKDQVLTPNGALLREAQLQSLEKIPNSEMVTTSDIGNENDIHPSEKEPIANRLAYVALHKDYDFKSIAYKNPIYVKSVIKEKEIEIYFDAITSKKGNGLYSTSTILKDFYIAGEDKVFYAAKATITKKRTILVSSDKVPNPKAVRYGFSNYFKGSIFNTFGFPLTSFRTDNWELKD